MARAVNRLTVTAIRNLKAPGLHADGNGLYLKVDDRGSKRWVFVFQWAGKRTEMGLGGLSDVGLAEARERRDEARKLVRQGQNPIEARSRGDRTEARTFGEIADELVASVSAGFKSDKHIAGWKRTFEKDARSLRAMPVDKVTTEDVLKILKPIWLTKADTARRTRGRIERVLDGAKAKGLISSPWENPARWSGHLAHLLPRSPRLTHGHRRAIPWQDAPDGFAKIMAKGGNGARCLAFAILTAARENAATGCRWREIDRKAAVWTIPGGMMGRMKGVGETPNDLRVPLSDAALAILDEMAQLGAEPEALVFPGLRGNQLSNSTMDRVLAVLEIDATPHGWRSTFKDWAEDATTFPDTLSEEALAHRVGDEVRQAYRRSDALERRRKLMQAWANYLVKPKGAVAFMRPSDRRA